MACGLPNSSKREEGWQSMAVLQSLSAALGARLERVHRQRVIQGRRAVVPMALWFVLPERVRAWLIYRIFRPAGDWLDARLREDAFLGSLNLDGRTSWSLSPDSLLILSRILRTRRPGYVLEFGSGASTVVAAQYASEFDPDGPPRIYTVDHDSLWLERTAEKLATNGLDRFVRLIHAPLTDEAGCPGQTHVSYALSPDIEAILSTAPGFDLCLIDGPPGCVGRLACLPAAVPRLRSGALVLLDDAYRPGERAAWRLWRRNYPSLRKSSLILTASGMAQGEWTD
jgi:predicted O-methyltransferase YrrM